MRATRRDLELSAAIVPIHADLEVLQTQLDRLCDALAHGEADSEQRTWMDTRLLEVSTHLLGLRDALIPGAPITVEAEE